MNANELADELRNTFSLGEKVTIKQLQKIVITINTLSQQQAEIEALKAELRLIDELVTGKAQEK